MFILVLGSCLFFQTLPGDVHLRLKRHLGEKGLEDEDKEEIGSVELLIG